MTSSPNEASLRKARLGVTLPIFRAEPRSLVECALEAERLGFDGVFVFDHLLPPQAATSSSEGQGPVKGDPRSLRAAPDCFALLGAVAAATQRVRFGPLVARVWYRAPAVTAAALRSLVAVGGRRVIAGLGVSDRLSYLEVETFGLAFPHQRERLETLERTVSAIRAESDVPIWLGGRSRAILEAAARLRAGVNLWRGTPEEVRAVVRKLVPADPQGFSITDDGPQVTWGGDVVWLLKPRRSGGDPWREAASELQKIFDAGASWAILGLDRPERLSEAARLASLVREFLEGERLE